MTSTPQERSAELSETATSPLTRIELSVLAIVLVALAAVAARPSIRGNDGVGHYVYLVSILRGGDLDFADDYRDFDTLKGYDFRFTDLPRSSVTGRASNRYGVGAALLWAPFVLVVHGVLSALGPVAADPLARPYEWAVGLGTIFWGSLGLGLLYVRLRRQWDPVAAGAVLAGALFATPLGFYLYAHGSMSHGVSFFAAVGAMLAFEKAWRRPGIAELAMWGGWAGLLTMIRLQDVTWAAAGGLLLGGRLIWQCLRPETSTANEGGRESCSKDSAATRHMMMAGAAALVFAPQMATWKILYGSWLSGPAPYLDGSAGQLELWPRHLLAALFSERGGALAWHPILAVGLAGLAVYGAKGGTLQPLALFGLLGFGLQAWLVGSWSMWWGGASFGNRFFISSLPPLAVGMAALLGQQASMRRRGVVLGTLFILIVWNMGLLVQYATEMIPREEEIGWSRVIRQNLIELPIYIWRRTMGG